MRLPFWGTVGIRPVKAVRTKEGGVAVYALNWETGEFELHMEYFSRIFEGTRDEVEEMDEHEFNEYVVDFKNERGI